MEVKRNSKRIESYAGGYTTEYGFVYNSLMADKMTDGMKAAQVCKQKANKYDYINVQGLCNPAFGCYYYNVRDKEREISLYSENIESYVIDSRDAKELMKLFDWVSDETFKNLEMSKYFTFVQLYMYIRVKAAQDEEFLTWWGEYNFRIVYKYEPNGYRFMKTIKG